MRWLRLFRRGSRAAGDSSMSPPEEWPERYRLVFFRLNEIAKADGCSPRSADDIAMSWAKSFKIEVEKTAARERKQR